MSWLDKKRKLQGMTREKILFLATLALFCALGYIVYDNQLEYITLDKTVYADTKNYSSPKHSKLEKPEEVSLSKLLQWKRDPFFPWRENFKLVPVKKPPRKTRKPRPPKRPKPPTNTGTVKLPPNPNHGTNKPGPTGSVYEFPLKVIGVQKKDGQLIAILESKKTEKIYHVKKGETIEGVLITNISMTDITLKGADGELVLRKDKLGDGGGLGDK